MANEKLAYRDCEVSKRMDGTYEVSGENLLDSGMSIRYHKNTLEEIHQAVDDAYKEAQANRDELAAHGVEAAEAHKKVAELDALTRQYGKQTIETAARAGAALASAKRMLKRGQWLPWLEKNCPGISDQTARNYIKVANALNSNSKPLLNCGSLMEAYVVLGIVSLRPKTKNPLTENPKGGDEKKNDAPTTEDANKDGDQKKKEAPTTESTQQDAPLTPHDIANMYVPELLAEAVYDLLAHTNDDDKDAVRMALEAIEPIVEWYNYHAPKPCKAKKSKKSRLEKAAESDVSIPLNDQPEKVLTE